MLRGVVATVSASLNSSTGAMASMSDTRAALDTMIMSVMVLQVTACAVVQCGPGRCVTAGSRAACDCAGTGFTGARCDEVEAGPTLSGDGSDDDGASDSVSIGANGPVDTAAEARKQCPSTGREECSGHGVCVRSEVDCPVTSVQCVAICR